MHVMQQARRCFSTSLQQFTCDPRAGTCPSVCTAQMESGWWPCGEHDAPLKPAFIGGLSAHARKKEAAAQLRMCTPARQHRTWAQHLQ